MHAQWPGTIAVIAVRQRIPAGYRYSANAASRSAARPASRL